MSWIYDVVVLVLMCLFLIRGAVEGGVKAVARFLLLGVSIFIAFTLASPIGDMVYDNYVKDGVKTFVAEGIHSVSDKVEGITSSFQIDGVNPLEAVQNGDIAGVDFNSFTQEFDMSKINIKEVLTEWYEATLADENLGALTEGAIGEQLQGVLQTLTEDGGLIDTIDTEIVNSGKPLDELLCDNILGPIVSGGIKVIAFLIMLPVLLLVGSLLISVLDIVNKIPLVGNVNKLLGAGVGLLEGVVFSYLLVCAVNMLIGAGVLTMLDLADLQGTVLCSKFLAVDIMQLWGTASNYVVDTLGVEIPQLGVH